MEMRHDNFHVVSGVLSFQVWNGSWQLEQNKKQSIFCFIY